MWSNAEYEMLQQVAHIDTALVKSLIHNIYIYIYIYMRYILKLVGGFE